MKPTFHRGLMRPISNVGLHAYYRQLEDNDLRYHESSNHEMCTARTEFRSPTLNQFNEMRSSKVLYKLCVSGLHYDTTEESLRQIFSNYGNPMSVSMFKRRNQQLVALVEFESQYEADNAIIGLNAKPPLNWEVTYSFTRPKDEVLHHCRQDEHFASPTMELERQTRVFPVSDVSLHPSYSRQCRRFIKMIGNDSSSAVIRSNRNSSVSVFPEFPTCVVCGNDTSFVCQVCKTRYCSSRCQSIDWPSHQTICKPLPALVPEMPDAVLLNGIVSRSSQDNPNIPIHSLQNDKISVAIRECHEASSEEFKDQRQSNGTAKQPSPDSYLIKGIHPLDQKKRSNQLVSVTIHRNLENGSQSKVSSPEVRTVQTDSHTIEPIQSQRSFLRSPEWKTSSSQCRLQNIDTASPSNGTSLQNCTLIGRQQEIRWRLPAVSKSRNFPLGNYCPKTPDSSPSRRTSQTQSADAPKVYAMKFSSVQLKQPLDKYNQVCVCSAKSPYEFFVQYCCYREMLQEIVKKVEMSVPNSEPLINPVEGLPCVAIFPEDRSWYRAQIMKILPDGIGIRYVDFGNSISMPNSPEHLRMMEHHISESPFCATKVKLANVLPLNGTSWDLDVRLKFKELVENRLFLMEFVQMDADVMCVRLKDQNGSDLVTSLLQKNLIRKATVEVSDELDRIPSVMEIPAQSSAERLCVKEPPISCFQLPNENVVTETNHALKIASRMNGLVFKELIGRSAKSCAEKSKIAPSETKFISSEDEVVPEKTNDLSEQPSNSVPKISACPMDEAEATYLNPVDISKDEGAKYDDTLGKFNYSDGPFLDLPENRSFPALIIKVENPQHIYLRVTNEELSTKLAKLKEALAAYANDVGGSHCPQENEVCVARFPDGQWYRAFCAYLDGSRYVCQQVDYGKKHAIDANDIRRITKDLIELVPYLAQHAILEGTESMDELEPKLVNRLQKILHENTEIDVVVVGRQDVSYIVRIPMVNHTLSFEGLI